MTRAHPVKQQWKGDPAAFAADPAHAGELDALEATLGYRFADRTHLARSLVHRSYLNEAGMPASASNERLEFLGDAVLQLAVTRALYRRFPEATEGQLTQLRAAIVRGEALTPVGERLKLGDYLRLGRGEQTSGGRRRPLNLARAFEAVVGAIFVDSSYHAAERWLLRVLKPELAAVVPGGGVDAKSKLQHWSQAERGVLPIYRTVEERGPSHERLFIVEALIGDNVVGHGEGLSKQAAEQAAAAQALAILG